MEKEIAEWAGPVVEEFGREAPRSFDRPPMRSYSPAQRPPASNQSRPPMPRRDNRPFNPVQGKPTYGPPPRREEISYLPPRPPQPPQQEKPKEVSLSALSSTTTPVDFKGHKIQEKPRNNNREKKEVDTGELKKLLEESLKKKE